MLGGDFERSIVVVVEFGLLIFVGDETTLYLRIVVGLLYNAKPGFVVKDSSPYYSKEMTEIRN